MSRFPTTAEEVTEVLDHLLELRDVALIVCWLIYDLAVNLSHTYLLNG